MTTTPTRNLLLRPSVATSSGNFGSAGATYGETNWTYGEQAQDSAETRYEVSAYPGSGPRTPDWVYRQWSTQPDMVLAVLSPDGVPLDYASVDTAELILTMTGYTGLIGQGTARYSPSYDLTVGADRLTRTWEEFDLPVVGRFRVNVKVTFNSGRIMTLPSTDDAAFVVRDGERP